MEQLVYTLLGIMILFLIIYIFRYFGRFFTKRPYYEEDDLDGVSFDVRKLLNYSEKRLFDELNILLKNNGLSSHYKILSQVNYGEMFRTKGRRTEKTARAFRAINTKRSDFLIVNNEFLPIVIIEYHGEGHFKGRNYAENDRIKAKVSSLGRVHYLVVHFNDKGRLKGVLERDLLPLLR